MAPMLNETDPFNFFFAKGAYINWGRELNGFYFHGRADKKVEERRKGMCILFQMLNVADRDRAIK